VGRLIGSCYSEWAVGRLIGSCYSEWAVSRLIQGLISDRWKRFCIFFKSIQTGFGPLQSCTLSVPGIMFVGLKQY